MKLHVLSDLHLSVSPFDPPSTDADVIVVAGDVGRPERASEWLRRVDRPAVYVAGNHEYYGGSIPGTIRELRRLCAGSDVHVLENDAVEIGGVRFLGTTLWTDFMLFGEGERRDLAVQGAIQFVRDFTRIRRDDDGDATFTPDDSARLFRDSARWLTDTLATPFAGPTVVVTHHSPSPRSVHPRFAESILNTCFVSDAEHLLDGARVPLWIHGHSHDSFDYVVNGTRVVCNPRGYSKNDVIENRRFDPGLVVEVGTVARAAAASA